MTKPKQTETALATRSANTAMAVADQAVAGDARGTENIDSEDVRLPFLAIAQKTTKAIDKTEAAYIPGLEFLQLYNSETQENYGDGPVQFIPIAMRKRAVLVDPVTKLNGAEIPWDDPRTSWDEAHAKGLDKPEAKRIFDWVVLLVPTMEMVVVSFQGKGFGAGKSLNGFVKIRKPSFAGVYTLAVARDQNDSGAFGKFKVAPAGKPTADQYAFAEAAFESIRGATIVTCD